ncbi:WhiB family transcriptional regulator [Mycolicibacterium sphagni]|uniref:Transcriptional regulator WhiB n=1 Tax=Mycolicibacterium sphagni TaxID=1786 RepID=A0A255DTH2_9MYCO|nr:WhiB family transcriptional regulator [Mycolicibacterium sphagni]MCV7178692.1 WhiB family transcriptional regulator [Mycolicibacterium sphagni]OYN82360.1 hypothetical protein CG716_03655 [Mycolicibacterium sphagni]
MAGATAAGAALFPKSVARRFTTIRYLWRGSCVAHDGEASNANGGSAIVQPSSYLSNLSAQRRHHLQPFVWEWEWQSLGHCVGQPGELFFPEDSPRGDRRKLEQQAKVICGSCPVRSRCLEHALKTPEPYGVWGATTARERDEGELRRRSLSPAAAGRSRLARLG